MLALFIKRFPNQLSIARRQPSFPEIETRIVDAIGDAVSPAAAADAYERFGSILPNWTFYVASDTGVAPGVSVNRSFSEGSVVRGLLPKERVMLLDSNIQQTRSTGSYAVLSCDYSIALDTQTVSYLEPYLSGNRGRLPKDFREVFEFIARDDVFVDPIPYMIENLPNILEEENVLGIKEKLIGYERLRELDASALHSTGDVRFKSSDEEIERRVDEHLSMMKEDAAQPEILESVLYDHAVMYSLLLKMTIIQLRKPQALAVASKVNEFLEFLNDRLHTLFLREIVVATEYFKKGQQLRFFGKIQRSEPDCLPELLDQLKNMAWDLLHLRMMEGMLNVRLRTTALRSRPRYYFPSLLTCDRRFIEVIDLYPLKAYAYCHDSGRILTFPEASWKKRLIETGIVTAKSLDEVLSEDAALRRRANRDNSKKYLASLIRELEEEFAAAAKRTG